MLGSRSSLNDLIRSQQQRWRDGEAEGLRGLQVDDQLELGGLLDRQVGGLGPLQNPVDIPGSDTPALEEIASIGDETTALDPNPRAAHRRQRSEEHTSEL